MTTLKRFASALTVCALLATTSLVASADDSASLYQTTNGGPTHLSETLEIYKNTGNSYYAECTYITSGTLRVTGNNNTPDKTLSFTTEKRIDFLATTNGVSLPRSCLTIIMGLRHESRTRDESPVSQIGESGERPFNQEWIGRVCDHSFCT